MNKVIIEGGNKLSGKVDISGFKNAALPIIVGTILADDKCKIDNLPMIGDVYNLVKIMEMLGSKVHLDESGYMDIDTSTISDSILIDEITRKMRASYYLLGACLSRFGEVKVLYQEDVI